MIVNNNDSPTISLFYNIGGGGNSGSSGCTMSITDPVPTAHGGLKAGSVISGQSPCQVLQTILFPYQAPSFTSFYIQSQNTTLEIGDLVEGGVRTFKWNISNPQNVVDNSIEIRDITENSVLGSSLANDGTEDLDIGADKQRTSPGSYTWRIIGRNSQGGYFQRDYRIYWYYKLYWGNSTSNTVTSSDILAMNGQLKDSFTGGYTWTNGGQPEYYYFIYPNSWGSINQWKDHTTGFAVAYDDLGIVDVTNGFNITVSYRVLRTTYKQTANLTGDIS